MLPEYKNIKVYSGCSLLLLFLREKVLFQTNNTDTCVPI